MKYYTGQRALSRAFPLSRAVLLAGRREDEGRLEAGDAGRNGGELPRANLCERAVAHGGRVERVLDDRGFAHRAVGEHHHRDHQLPAEPRLLAQLVVVAELDAGRVAPYHGEERFVASIRVARCLRTARAAATAAHTVTHAS